MSKPTVTVQPKATPKTPAPTKDTQVGEFGEQTPPPEKPKATRMPRYITQHYAKLEECGIKRKDLKPFAEHMDFEGMGEEKVSSFFTQTNQEIKMYVNEFYGVEEDYTEAETEDVPTHPNEAMASQEHTEAQTQETNTQQPKAGVSMARYKGTMISKGVNADDVDEFFTWANIDTSNIAQFLADEGAVASLIEQFNAEAGYAEN